MKTFTIRFIIIYNILSSLILLLNDLNVVSIESIWIRLIINLLFIWNILLLTLIFKKTKNEKNK